MAAISKAQFYGIIYFALNNFKKNIMRNLILLAGAIFFSISLFSQNSNNYTLEQQKEQSDLLNIAQENNIVTEPNGALVKYGNTGNKGPFDLWVEIGNGTSYGAFPSNYADFSNYWENAHTQTLYLASELGAGEEKIITGLQYSFERIAAAPDNWLSNIEIRIATTSDNELTPGAYYDMSSASLVYSSSNYTPALSTGWADIIDINDFTYNGTDNLIIDILWGDNGYYESTYYRTMRTNGGATRVLLGYADSETPPTYDDYSEDYSNIRFYYEAAAPVIPISNGSFALIGLLAVGLIYIRYIR